MGVPFSTVSNKSLVSACYATNDTGVSLVTCQWFGQVAGLVRDLPPAGHCELGLVLVPGVLPKRLECTLQIPFPSIKLCLALQHSSSHLISLNGFKKRLKIPLSE